MSAIEQIKRHESVRLYVYDDATGRPIVPGTKVIGHPTIGWGRCLDTNGITQDEADWLFGNDFARIRYQLDRELPWWRELDAARQTALMDMTFNLGIGGLLTFTRMLAALKEGRHKDAATEALDSKWARQVGRRARVIADQIRYG